jgi:hypothetical protein
VNLVSFVNETGGDPFVKKKNCGVNAGHIFVAMRYGLCADIFISLLGYDLCLVFPYYSLGALHN